MCRVPHMGIYDLMSVFGGHDAAQFQNKEDDLLRFGSVEVITSIQLG